MIRTILFDLDDTLYPRSAGIMGEIRRLILDFVRTRLDLPAEEADALRARYLQDYGTTMRGLQVNHQIDPHEYLLHVHEIPLREYLQPNPELDAVLATIRQEMVIFTNASREHAERVLDVLGISQHFSRIVDVRDMAYESKPQPSAYARICELLGVEPEECVLVEDNVRNLCPAKDLGMSTVLVGDGSQSRKRCVDYAIDRVELIGGVLAKLGIHSFPDER
ncbi:MAG: pyrimidine 5'-nucleotidase [Anaerolineae bacterium]|nr:pyrimidine 5'-nucleotidase [Anaerolineae bacterium]